MRMMAGDDSQPSDGAISGMLQEGQGLGKDNEFLPSWLSDSGVPRGIQKSSLGPRLSIVQW